MGTCHYHLLMLLHNSSFTTAPPSLRTTKLIATIRPLAAGPRWKNAGAGGPSSTGRFGFSDNLEDDEGELLAGENDDEFGFFGGTGSAGKQRRRRRRSWWSDDSDGIWTVGEEDEDGDDDCDDWFSIFKVVRSFAWVLPAIAVSFLVGTGSNAFIMALAVPLGQMVLSLVIDKVWGSTSSSPRRSGPRTRYRKKPFTRYDGSRSKTNERKEETKTEWREATYETWVATDKRSDMKSGAKRSSFGGWDDLDRARNKSTRVESSHKTDGVPKQQTEGKLSRTRSYRDTPLFLRLVIAVFPFLGSWTKFLF